MLLETKFSIAAARIKVFASVTSPHNSSYSCSNIPVIFHLIEKVPFP